MISSRALLSGLLGLVVLAGGTARAATVYNAVNDFSGTNGSPSVWSYGYNVSDPLETPTLLDQYYMPFSGLTAWHNAGGSCCGGGTSNNSVLLGKNTTSGPISYYTIVQPTNYLEQDPESNASVDLIFTAQTAGTYNVSFGFLGIDTQAKDHGAGHGVDVLVNGSLLRSGYIGGYGNSYGDTLSIFLGLGDTLDFQTLTSPTTFAYLSTGVQAELTLSAVPLPASAPMFGVALVALGAVGYGVKRRRGAPA